MELEHLISTDDFCIHHRVEISFVNSLHDYGLIEITTVQEKNFIHIEQLQRLEKLIRLHYELDINMEGIETIIHMLDRIHTMQDEIVELKNKLRIYEG